MGDNTKIEWADSTWTPIRARLKSEPARIGWHCEHASPGCVNCYAESMNERRFGTGLSFKPGHRKDVEIFLDEKLLLAPLRWRKARRIFVCSMTDLFAEFVTDDMIDRMFAVMALCPHHTFQVLTKRPARMRQYFRENTGWRARIATLLNDLKPSPLWNGNVYQGWQRLHGQPNGLPNVWLGTSVEDQARADERIPELLATPAAVRFLSCEPLLGPVDLSEVCGGHFFQNPLTGHRWHDAPEGVPAASDMNGKKIDWVIVGGESGGGSRPMDNGWAQSIVDQCKAAGVAVFVKQLSAGTRANHDISTFPSGLQVREVPNAAR